MSVEYDETSDGAWKMIGSRKVANELRQRAYYTPDNSEISEYEWHLLYIDNIMRPKYGKQGSFLKDAKYLGAAYTAAPDFSMRCTAHYPVTFFAKKTLQARRTVGDVYAVNTFTLRNFDRMFGNGVMWHRTKHFIVMEDQLAPFKQGHKRVVTEAFMYLGVPSAFETTPLAYASTTLNHREISYEWDPDVSVEF